MTHSVTDLSYARAPMRRAAPDLWATVDAFLLVVVFATSSDMLIQVGGLQSPVWMLCYLLALLRIATLWPYFLTVLQRNKLIFAFPVVALSSVLWSVSPVDTLVLSLQLFMTVLIAAYLGWRYSLFALTKALAVVLSAAAVLSLLHWATGIFPWPVHAPAGGLMGIYSQKNMLGQRMLFATIAILTLWLMPQSRMRAGAKRAFILPLFLVLFALILSKSVTTMLLLPMALGMWLVLLRRYVPAAITVPVLLAGALLLAIVPLLLGANGIDPIEATLDAFGKSSTLTGRTLIWDVALGVIAEHPILGVGYRAFWLAPQFANGQMAIVDAGAVTSRSFHNFVLEILVSAGWPGLIAMFALLGVTLLRLWQLFTDFHSVEAGGAIVQVVFSVGLSLLGTSLFRGHEIMLIMVVAFMVSSQEDRIARQIDLRGFG